ncbi:hypothetical protein Adt_25267 [Abeliophyllum distichum]|uniref:Transmembrane protein 131-like N-terminal domain-containing protein n=1 Tax=Abeliophyllum distichum TaxID=126358 RepID=A0ABD1SJ56_9LAMI
MFRGFFCSAKSFYFVVVLLCALSILAICEPFSVNGEQNRLEFEACRSYRGNSDTNFPDVFDGQSNSNFVSTSLMQKHNIDNVCADLNAFCFPSILPGFYSKENDDESHVLDVSEVMGGKTISCSLFYQEDCRELPCHISSVRSSQQSDISSWRSPLLYRKTQSLKSGENTETVKFGFVDGLSRPQFYHCNFSEMVLVPGEVASIYFVFLPAQLGLSSAQLVLQTSFGGFLIQVKGFGVNSPYGIKPLVGLDVSSSGKWRKEFVFA